mgnify:CR=1 FL=1
MLSVTRQSLEDSEEYSSVLLYFLGIKLNNNIKTLKTWMTLNLP